MRCVSTTGCLGYRIQSQLPDEQLDWHEGKTIPELKEDVPPVIPPAVL